MATHLTVLFFYAAPVRPSLGPLPARLSKEVVVSKDGAVWSVPYRLLGHQSMFIPVTWFTDNKDDFVNIL